MSMLSTKTIDNILTKLRELSLQENSSKVVDLFSRDILREIYPDREDFPLEEVYICNAQPTDFIFTETFLEDIKETLEDTGNVIIDVDIAGWLGHTFVVFKEPGTEQLYSISSLNTKRERPAYSKFSWTVFVDALTDIYDCLGTSSDLYSDVETGMNLYMYARNSWYSIFGYPPTKTEPCAFGPLDSMRVSYA